MRKMRDSGNMWIGATPETWKMIPLKYLASYNDEVLSENTDDEFEFDYIEIGSVQYGRGIIYTEHMKFKNAPSRARRIVRKDDIIVSTVRTYLKAVATIPACNNSLIASTGFIVIRPHKVLPRFMNYALLSESFISLVESHSTGISYPAINSVDVVKFKIPVPCRSEQERIAAFLDAECAEIDTVLEKTRASIEEYKKLKQAVITQAVTKGIRGDRPMKDSGIEWIGEIANEFAVYKFKYLLKTPMQYGANEAGITFDKTLPRYIRITDITSDGRLKQDNRLCIEDTVAKPYILQDGDLLFARSGGTVGKSFLYKQSYGNAAFAGYLIRAVVNRTIAVPEYVYYYTNSSIYDTWKNSIFIQSTIQNIGADRYSNMPIIVPNNIEEQRSIVEYLNERCVGIDALIRKKQQYLTEIENYKKSLIYEYVTGKKEVV